jgi:hypothetical protein
MFRACRLALLAVLLLPIPSLAADKEIKFDQWRPVEQWEKDIKDVPGDPGAPAIQLYYGLTRDDPAQFEYIYRRIKVLTEKGKGHEYADVEIELGSNLHLADLKARTIHPDGKMIDFDGRIFDKTIVKTRGFKISAKAFSFSDVTVGSILEYRYRLTWKGNIFFYSIWPLQHKLYTSKEEFRFRAYRVIGRIAYTYLNQLNDDAPQLRGDYWQLNLEKVPGMVEEEYAPPDDEYRPLVFFYYGGNEIASPESFWREVARFTTQNSEKFIGNSKEVQALAAETIAGETGPEKKLRKLYARAQQIRNLSFERSRTEEEMKKEGLKLPENAADVIKRQYGTRLEINRLFVALARAAGFEAVLMRVADREDFTFNKSILFPQQLATEIAAVELNGKMIFLDPGTRFCPYGLLRWMHTAVTALRLGKDGGGFVDIPAPLPSDSFVKRTAELSIDETGKLAGELTLEFMGDSALEHRLDALDADEAGRKKPLEDEVLALLPPGSTVKLKDSQGWTDEDKPLVARFSLEVPSYAAITGKRVVVPVFPFQNKNKIFVDGNRRVPIVFPFSVAETDLITIMLPHGYNLEHPPHERKTALYDARYEIRNSLAGNQLTVKRSLGLNGIRFGAGRFMDMKEFFDVVQAGDEGQAILQVESANPAQ